MNEPPGARARVALTALSIAEYFRDEEKQDVLLFVDNIFRFTQAGSEASLYWVVFLLPLVTSQLLQLKWSTARAYYDYKRWFNYLAQVVYVPADDYTDPAPATTFTHLDASTNLSRRIAQKVYIPC